MRKLPGGSEGLGTRRQLGVAVALVQVRGSNLDQVETLGQREDGGTGALLPGGTGEGKGRDPGRFWGSAWTAR